MLYKKVMDSPALTVLSLAIIAGTAEFFIMLMLSTTLTLPPVLHAVVDPLILIVVISPVLYLYIAKRKQTEKTMRQMALFAALNPAPVLRFDSRGRLLSANPAAVDIFGKGARKSTPLAALLPSLADIDLGQCVRDGLTIVREGAVGQRYFQFVLRGIPESGIGHIYGSDITEHKQMEERLVAAERLTTLGQFSGSISHELRNPLGVIDSSVYYLKTKLKDADMKVQQHLDRIKLSVDSSTAIIESLLNLTRMKEPQLGELHLVAVISDAIATSKVPAKVKVIRNFPESEVLVSGDSEQLRIAFKNIVKNAVEAMDGSGMLTITVRRTADDEAEVSFADTGPGIAEEDLGRVFQPLFSTKAKGIGFGLSITEMIIDKHGGTIEVKSESGKEGATLIVRLPPHVDKGEET